jgi:hypothetical protein
MHAVSRCFSSVWSISRGKVSVDVNLRCTYRGEHLCPCAFSAFVQVPLGLGRVKERSSVELIVAKCIHRSNIFDASQEFLDCFSASQLLGLLRASRLLKASQFPRASQLPKSFSACAVFSTRGDMAWYIVTMCLEHGSSVSHSPRTSIFQSKNINFLFSNMSIQIGFDPFNFAITLVSLIVTAMNLYWTRPRNTRRVEVL